MTWADRIARILRTQDDYFHDAGLFAAHQLLRFQIAHGLWALRRSGVLVAKRERFKGARNGTLRNRSRMIYTVIENVRGIEKRRVR
jgi:hypothetical protein